MLGVVGVIEMDVSVADVTVSAVDPETPPNDAVTVVVPMDEEVANP